MQRVEQTATVLREFLKQLTSGIDAIVNLPQHALYQSAAGFREQQAQRRPVVQSVIRRSQPAQPFVPPPLNAAALAKLLPESARLRPPKTCSARA